MKYTNEIGRLRSSWLGARTFKTGLWILSIPRHAIDDDCCKKDRT